MQRLPSVKIVPVWFTLQAVFNRPSCASPILTRHRPCAQEEDRRKKQSSLCGTSDTSRHPKTTGCVPHTKAKRLRIKKKTQNCTRSCLFKAVLCSKTRLSLALSESEAAWHLHLPLPLFANPIGSQADSYLRSLKSSSTIEPSHRFSMPRHG